MKKGQNKNAEVEIPNDKQTAGKPKKVNQSTENEKQPSSTYTHCLNIGFKYGFIINMFLIGVTLKKTVISTDSRIKRKQDLENDPEPTSSTSQ